MLVVHNNINLSDLLAFFFISYKILIVWNSKLHYDMIILYIRCFDHVGPPVPITDLQPFPPDPSYALAVSLPHSCLFFSERNPMCPCATFISMDDLMCLGPRIGWCGQCGESLDSSLSCKVSLMALDAARTAVLAVSLFGQAEEIS